MECKESVHLHTRGTYRLLYFSTRSDSDLLLCFQETPLAKGNKGTMTGSPSNVKHCAQHEVRFASRAQGSP